MNHILLLKTYVHVIKKNNQRGISMALSLHYLELI